MLSLAAMQEFGKSDSQDGNESPPPPPSQLLTGSTILVEPKHGKFFFIFSYFYSLFLSLSLSFSLLPPPPLSSLNPRLPSLLPLNFRFCSRNFFFFFLMKKTLLNVKNVERTRERERETEW
ncbi:hypothetical protein Phum_PHUM193870 [Pediculus humanus corporis]|uniref:Uncharacterized protein n=1 Tax=Pediculus humanus subsp. corporis TaxID=121224 RepID=E0VGV3_PEDHC|nr:uncharacterized protein Phum_PHUM193870 [Pediculus humanus corporis]EEB12609.1 hypothetical protein Phum_PHUM193870 [Pediculus humanus corporis]